MVVAAVTWQPRRTAECIHCGETAYWSDVEGEWRIRWSPECLHEIEEDERGKDGSDGE